MRVSCLKLLKSLLDCLGALQHTALQHTATHCNTLQHTTAHCSTLQRTATHWNAHWNTLQHTASQSTQTIQENFSNLRRDTHYNTLQHSATKCNTLHYTKIHCNIEYPKCRGGFSVNWHRMHYRTLQHTATHCNTLQHTATHCNTLQHTATHLYFDEGRDGGTLAWAAPRTSCRPYLGANLYICNIYIHIHMYVYTRDYFSTTAYVYECIYMHTYTNTPPQHNTIRCNIPTILGCQSLRH